MVAFEQCHKKCKPDATAFAFFFNGLVNSAKGVEILHYKGRFQNSLGSYEEAADLVNSQCKEVDWDGEDSYLHKVVSKDNGRYFKSRHAKLGALLVHYYFSNWVQTGCSIADMRNDRLEKSLGSHLRLQSSFFSALPLLGLLHAIQSKGLEQGMKFEDMQLVLED